MGRWNKFKYDFDFRYFPPSRPRQVKGGIKSQNKRGSFGESWWARRWIEVLESFQIGARLGRGRSYARNGQVLSIDINKGTIQATVQGSRPKPYTIEIKVKTLPAASWRIMGKVLSLQPIFAAKLLAGEMPQAIEEIFNKAGLTLFPNKSKDLHTECSCPDWSNPCKHIAAVYYLLGEEFDRDPFLIFKLRGMGREGLMELLGRSSGQKEKKGTARKTSRKRAPEMKEETLPPSEPLSAEASRFWAGESLPDDLLGEVRIPPLPAALPKKLGPFPFWRGEERFLETLEPIYAQASPLGLSVFLGSPLRKGETVQN